MGCFHKDHRAKSKAGDHMMDAIIFGVGAAFGMLLTMSTFAFAEFRRRAKPQA